MTKPVYHKEYASDYSGIDGQTSALEKDDHQFSRAINFESAISNSLRGRVGCQIAGQAGGFFGLFPYNYSRTQDEYAITYGATQLLTTKTAADGASIQKTIAIGTQVYVLDTFTYSCTKTSGNYPFTWFTKVNGSNIEFNIQASGGSLHQISLGDGVTSNTSVYSFLNSIDALAELSVSRTTRGTCPPFAVVNGNQATTLVGSCTYGLRYSVTVNNPHNFQPGDILTFPDLQGGFVTARTNTTITYAGVQKTLTSGDVLGYMNQTAACFPISTISTASSGTIDIVMPYWRLIPEGDASTSNSFYGDIFADSQFVWSAKTSNSFFAPPNSTCAQGCVYIASSAENSRGDTGYPNNLIKVDGTQPVRAGLPSGPLILFVLPGTPGALNGNYNYRAFYRRVDAQGNITEGPLGGIYSVSAVNEIVDFNVIITNTGIFTDGILYSYATGFQGRSAFKYGAESPAAGTAFAVDDGTGAPGLQAFLQPGDPICLLDNVAPVTGAPTGTLHRTRCTFYDGTTAPSSIKVADSSGYTIPNDTPISTGLTVVVLRTSAGGNQYYVLSEIPITGYGDVGLLADNVADSDLVGLEQFQEPELGKEHNPPPACSIVCQHQGGLVVARGFNAPNTVSFSTADGIEYFPTASNSFDVPSTISGPVSAIASDQSDRLAVFKDRAYYDVQGDLDGGAFSVNVVTEGDYGVASQAAILRMTDSLIGLGRLGFIIIQAGNMNPQIFSEMNAKLINQSYNFNWSTAFNDYFNRCIVFTVPTTSTPVGFVIDYSKQKVAMSAGLSSYAALGVGKGANFNASYMNIRTFDRSYATQIDQGGGGAMNNDTLYHLSSVSPFGVFRRLQRFSSNSPTGNDGDTFIDNTGAINYVLETQPIVLDEPAQLKTPIRIRTWSIPNDFVVDGWVTFSATLDVGATSKNSLIGSANPLGFTSIVSFGAATPVFFDVKVTNCKTFFYIVRYTVNTIRQAPFLTGFEVKFVPDYEKEDLMP